MSRIRGKEYELGIPVKVPGKDFALPKGKYAFELMNAIDSKKEYGFLPSSMKEIYDFRSKFSDRKLFPSQGNYYIYDFIDFYITGRAEFHAMVSAFIKSTREITFSEEAMKIILDFVGFLIPNICISYRSRLLYMAVGSCQIEIFEKLLEEKVDIHYEDGNHTSLCVYLERCSKDSNPKVVASGAKCTEILKRHGYEID